MSRRNVLFTTFSSPVITSIAAMPMEASFNASSKAEGGEAPKTYVDAKDVGRELEDICETTVAEKHRGTIADQHDMQVLGRVQELRV